VSDGTASPLRAAWWILALATLVRLGLATTLPLFPDEAYYWEWSRRLAAGYFDHPPLIAWVVRAGTAIAGATPLGVRLGAVLSGAVAGVAMVLATRRLAGTEAAERASWLAALLPFFIGGFVLATPDAPLLACGAMTLLALVHAVEDDETGWWLVAGAFTGLAFLAKYTAVLLPAIVAATCVWHRPLRAQLGRPGPWLAAGVALLVATPVVWWNATHDWASFRFQLNHGLGAPRDRLLAREADYIGGQLLLASPVLLVLFVREGVVTLRRGLGSARVLLAAVSCAILLFFAVSAMRRRPEANWPALAYPAAVVLLATGTAALERVRAWRAGVLVAGLFTLAPVLAAFPSILPVPSRLDPYRKARGWDVLADSVDAVARRTPGPLHLAANRYQQAAMLGWYLPGHPDVTSLNIGGRANQYELWAGFRERAARGDALLLVLTESAAEPAALGELRAHFDTVERGPLVRPSWHGSALGAHRVWLLRGWHGTWRPADVPSAPAAR
jgi:4-amino-4-deoxy-L-arabinose transferase-like glycosyltransferase